MKSMTVEEFLDRYEPYPAIREEMKKDLEEMIQEAKNDVMDIPARAILGECDCMDCYIARGEGRKQPHLMWAIRPKK